jgi:S1-C subfamily serine protease
MMNFRFALSVVLGLALVACGKTPEPTPAPVAAAAASAPSLESAQPVEQADPSLQAMARSVVRIELNEGATGSGFFISPRIILTNHHVVPRERCSEKACPGVSAVRGFYRGGENQVFYRLKPLAFNRTLDFMFLEVLDGAAPVEGLPLASAAEIAKLTESDTLFALGHPLSAPLKASPAALLDDDGDDLVVDSAIFLGNSGGPLVHLPSGKVVGLVSEVSHDLMKYDVGSKSIPFQASATKISTVVAALQRDYPDTRGALTWDAHQFIKQNTLTDVWNSFFAGPLKSPESFFAAYRFSPEQITLRSSLVISELQRDPDAKERVEQFLMQLVRYDLHRGKSSALSPQLLASIEKSVEPGQALTRFMNFYHPERRDACAKNSSQKRGSFQTIGKICHRTHFPDGADVLEVLWLHIKGSDIDEEQSAFALLSVLEDQLLLRTALDSVAKKSVNGFLPRLDELIKHGIMRTRLDSFKITWETHPEMLLNGGHSPSY